VIHHSLNSAGGGERVAIHTVKLLLEMGFDVTLATTEKTDWRRVESILGVKLPRRPREVYLLPHRLPAFGIYQRLMTSLHVARLKPGADLVINTHGDVLLVQADITYLHFPVLAYWYRGYLKPWFKYLKSVFWRIYFTPYKFAEDILAYRAYSNSILLTNSRYSRQAIRELFGRDALIVYPPVEIEDYAKLAEVEDREDAVVYIARFSEEKNNHVLVYLAKVMPKVKFFLIGSAVGKGLSYLRYCLYLKRKLGVDNIYILPNLPHTEKLRILARCKVYVHLFPTEHFGISVVEALAAGLVPVVPKESGSWTDIVEEGRYGLGYERLSIEELSELVDRALDMWSPRRARLGLEQARKFSAENFYARMRRVVELAARRLV